MSDQTPIMIRPLGAVNEFHACEEIQKLAWGHGDELVVPAHMLLTIAKTGGLLLGAFEPGTTFTITVIQARDLAGNSLSGGSYAWSFKTAYTVYLPATLK